MIESESESSCGSDEETDDRPNPSAHPAKSVDRRPVSESVETSVRTQAAQHRVNNVRLAVLANSVDSLAAPSPYVILSGDTPSPRLYKTDAGLMMRPAATEFYTPAASGVRVDRLAGRMVKPERCIASLIEGEILTGITVPNLAFFLLGS